jgi:catechol 2,3-dioxygenase
MESVALAQPAGSNALLGAGGRLGAVALTVTDLTRSIAFYTDVIGLETLRHEAGLAVLGSGGQELVALHEDPAATRPGRTAGIYHYALLFPTREELARAAIRVIGTRTRIDGASDHGTHEAIYLPDPDGIGIELAADRPRELWPSYADSEFMRGGPKPLDVDDLLASVAGEAPSPRAAAGLRIGHVHLHVSDLEAATRFYRDGVGFEVMATLPSAVFVSFAGYHHHLAYNLWRGRDIPPTPTNVIGLRHWTLELVDQSELERTRQRLDALGVSLDESESGLLVRDPAGIALLLSARS